MDRITAQDGASVKYKPALQRNEPCHRASPLKPTGAIQRWKRKGNKITFLPVSVSGVIVLHPVRTKVQIPHLDLVFCLMGGGG